MLSLLALATGLYLALPAGTQGQDGQKKGKGQKSEVVEVDLSKLPPELAQKLREYQGKGTGKGISLIQAIKIVEATGKGDVERAERRTKKGETVFHIEVNTGERERLRFTLDAHGKITDTRKGEID
jgi:uncharacterized membrane protein YkoI